MSIRQNVISIIGLGLWFVTTAVQAENWQPIKNPDQLKKLFSDTTMETTLKEDVKAIATYKRDGTGEIQAWGDTFKRTWDIRGKDQACVGLGEQTYCYTLERDLDAKNRYRATNLTTRQVFILTIKKTGEKKALLKSARVEGTTTEKGGAAKPSAEEMAAKLANPNAPLASLTFKLQYRTFEGTLPDAHNQSSTTVLFQPSFPFKLDNGDVIFFRPAIPLIADQPVFNTATSSFESESGMGDISFDLAYGRTTKQGVLYAFGVISSVPTATEDSL